MQPMLALTASHPGIIYINGQFSGEFSRQQPLLRPVQGFGPLYLDYRPLDGNCLPMVRKIVFSGGTPMTESAEEAEGTSIVIWPGNITEVELLPEETAATDLAFSMLGRSFLLERNPPQLLCEGKHLGKLPPGAEIPGAHRLSNGIAITGKCSGGAYLVTCDADFGSITGSLQASRIEIEADGRIRVLVDHGDTVGHATMETWRLTENGLMQVASENVWAQGTPHWPQTAAQTACALVEAAIGGLYGEMEGYLSPALRSSFPAEEIRRHCDLCVEMKYAPPDARPAVGLLRMEGAIARVEPLYFHASACGGPQGPYRIERVELG